MNRKQILNEGIAIEERNLVLQIEEFVKGILMTFWNSEQKFYIEGQMFFIRILKLIALVSILRSKNLVKEILDKVIFPNIET